MNSKNDQPGSLPVNCEGAMREALEAAIDPLTGCMSFARYVETALYAPTCGYYRRSARRVGRVGQGDFQTAEGLGEVFAQLVFACAARWLGENPAAYTFIHLGAESGGNDAFARLAHPFSGYRACAFGDPLEIPAKAVVFANEVLDAQPFHRLLYVGGCWRERGVRIGADGSLREVLLPFLSEPVAACLETLPARADEGYVLDLPTGTRSFLKGLTAGSWSGLFFTFDYGLSWAELTQGRPQGTARGYREHRPVEDLLRNPGGIDLTHHICWDWVEEELEIAGFKTLTLDRQESVFMNGAADFIAGLLQDASESAADRRRTLCELLHPAYFGSRFQGFLAQRILS